ncbi:dehydrogenase [Candidatus Kapabacteria bacterium]|nr:dehydrogenase [Candidatus Kapabacteria bacterium]
MIYRAKAPLRLGLAGGGTDVSPYSDEFGGAILNSTISLYAYASIKETNDGKIKFSAMDRGESAIVDSKNELEINGELDLLKGVYNRIVKDFTKKKLSFELTTWVDAPAGSGLGTSSTLTVAILGAFVEWLNLPLGEYDISHLAYEIERLDLNMAGGKQDQYAATFGGFNFMEFYKNDKVIVNPLRVKKEYINELNFNLLLYYTGTSRLSGKIIDSQTMNVINKEKKSLEGMHKLKEQAIKMKESVLRGEINNVGEILDFGWKYKKQLAKEISNPVIDDMYNAAKSAGALGGKISGAGGGGFMMFFCPQNTRYNVINALKEYGGEFRRYMFTKNGMNSWRTNT